MDPYGDAPDVARLTDRFEPFDDGATIQGDLTGMSCSRTAAAALIDLSLYWRRTGASVTAIVVADALVWKGADKSLLESGADVDDFAQNAASCPILYRLVAAVEGGSEDDEPASQRRDRGAVDVAIAAP